MRQRWPNVLPSVANNGTTFYFLTNKDAPQYKLVTVDITHPAEQRVFKDILPEDKDAHLEDVLADQLSHNSDEDLKMNMKKSRLNFFLPNQHSLWGNPLDKNNLDIDIDLEKP